MSYTGNSVTTARNHNLGVSPELIILKERGSSGFVGSNWGVWASPISSKSLFLNANNIEEQYMTMAVTSTTFTDSGLDQNWNLSTYPYIAYLFASCPGVSKVGKYTGTGTTQSIDCGFTSGARFLIIKRTDVIGDWYIWDSARGIIAGDDPYILLNSANAEVTNTDYIDPYSLGFQISSTAPAEINANSGTYIFLAIA